MTFKFNVFRPSIKAVLPNSFSWDSPLTTNRRVLSLQKRFSSGNKWSYFHRGGNVPLSSATIGDFVDSAAEIYGDNEAVVNTFQGIRKTFTQYTDDINKFAAGLLSLNLNIGDRIGLWSPNCYEWVVAQHAAAKAGLILVPLNPAYQAPEVEYCIRKVGLKAMIIYDQLKTQDYHQILTKIMPEINETKVGNKIKSKSHPYFESLITINDKQQPGAVKYSEILQAATSDYMTKLENLQQKITMDKPVYIMFTSGTTGKPKGVVLSHHGVINGSITVRDRYEYGIKKYRTCTVVPMFHVIGNMTVSLDALISGYTVVLTGPMYNPGLALKAIQEDKCSDIVGPATIFADMLNHPDFPKTDVSSMERLRMGGSLCPPPLVSRLSKEWKTNSILMGYGSTELSGSLSIGHDDDSPHDKLYTCGKPVEFMEVKVVDSNGNLVPRGQAGEICARGYKVMLGYWDEEEKTREVLKPDGWYHTGDVGIMLDSGCLQIVDRIRDMIIRGGENIYPKEIEDFLMGHPKILEAHVIGVPDNRMGEEVCAWVQCRRDEKLTEEDLREFCKGKLSHFKIPRYVRFVQQFPKTLSGKVQKHVMREEEVKLRGQEDNKN